MKLYFNPRSPNSRKALAVKEHLGVELELHAVDIPKGENQQPEFLKLNPNAKVPVLVDGNFVLWESNAVMAYLASKKSSALWPEGNARFDVMRWMFWEQAHWQPALSQLIWQRVFVPMRGGQPDPKAIEKGEVEVKKYAAILNAQLEGKKWVTGNELTLADFALAGVLTYKDPAQAPLAEFKNLLAWYARFEELEAWKKTAPKW